MTVLRHVVAMTVLPLLLGLGARPAPLAGAFALQEGVARTDAFLTTATTNADPLQRRLDLWLTRRGNVMPITQYDVELTKRLHLIVVSDDLQHFEHVHPTLEPGGHFRLDERFPARSRYYLFADTEPAGIGQQVFRFALALGPAAARRLGPSRRLARVDAYDVALSTTSVRAGTEAMLTVHVRRGDRPASDLHPYIGALAHVVLIGERDLSYVHVHPTPLDAPETMGDMLMVGGAMHTESPALPDSAVVPPSMRVHFTLRARGRYKMWFQFRGGSAVHVAPFVIDAT